VPGRVATGHIAQVRLLGLVELQRPGEGADHLIGEEALPALFDAAVVISRQPGQERDLFLTQPRYPTRSGKWRDTRPCWGEAIAPGSQERRQRVSLGTHETRLSRVRAANLVMGCPGSTHPGRECANEVAWCP
jgi:hypothetical protein